MKTAKLICWQRTASDTRDTAGSTVSLDVPQSKALARAREIYQFGDREHSVMGGHPVVIVYATGRRRTIAGHDD